MSSEGGAGRRALAALAVGAALFGASAWWVAGWLTGPAPRAVRPPPADLDARPVSIEGAGVLLRGWLVRPRRPRSGAVVLAHGIRGTRRQMLSRARWLRREGYGALLYDHRAHGESGGDRVTLGASESEDLRAAVGWLRGQLPGEPVAVIGMSLGAASALLADPPLAVEALVLESSYATVDEAVRNRVESVLGPLAFLEAPLGAALLVQLRPRLGLGRERLRPVDRIGSVRGPVLVIGGGDDRHARVDEQRRLFTAAPAPKELWLVEGARHENLHRVAPADYERRVGAFLGSYLRPGGTGAGTGADATGPACKPDSVPLAGR